ncbi:MAG: transposase [Planctomycetia bacterium]|nr:transposase [Planctomycetia bacterium]
MLTCKSPFKVMRVAHHFAALVLPRYSSRFSRRDFTLPQLFACLVVREHQRKSFRGIEALLRDAPHWGRSIGMRKTPDHNTLWRAVEVVFGGSVAERMLDRLTRWMQLAQLLGTSLSIDSTLHDSHHRSRHYENRVRHYARCEKIPINQRRSRTVRARHKLTLGVDPRAHFVLAACSTRGTGGDHAQFPITLRRAVRRHPRIKLVLADAGYDSHENHRFARKVIGVRALIKAGIGRPGAKPPTSQYRRRMKRELTGSQAGKPYGQRSGSECVNSMMKRNFEPHFRARTERRRHLEQLLRTITHNVMIV